MKYQPNIFVCIVSVLCVAMMQSCSVQKRVLRPGFHVDWAAGQPASASPRSIDMISPVNEVGQMHFEAGGMGMSQQIFTSASCAEDSILKPTEASLASASMEETTLSNHWGNFIEVEQQQEKGTNQFLTVEEPDSLQDAERDVRTNRSLLYSASFLLASTIGYIFSVRGAGGSEFIEDSLGFGIIGGGLVVSFLFFQRLMNRRRKRKKKPKLKTKSKIGLGLAMILVAALIGVLRFITTFSLSF
ncbi:hypothetical protein N9L13_05240 [Flavobacteriales bacterium]|nr:hypothetical protein [Flavobacteriales bacterium]